MDNSHMQVLIVLIVFAFLLAAYFSSVKLLFRSFKQSVVLPEEDRLRFYWTRVSDILEEPRPFNAIMTAGRIGSVCLVSILCYMYISETYLQLRFLYRVFLSFGISFIALLFAHFTAGAFALRFYRTCVPSAYLFYKAASWFLVPFAILFLAMHRSMLRIFGYDEKLSFLSQEEQARITESDTQEYLDKEEREMIRSIFDLGDTTVSEIMVPRINIKALDIHSDLKTVLTMISEEAHSRIPVYRETTDTIVGILYVKDILSWLAGNKPETWNMQQILKKPHFVPMGKKINDLMKEFKARKMHIAVVVDEYGGTAGVVTLEDILEEIVGEIQDEYDIEEQPIVKLSDDIYIVEPHVDLDDLSEGLGVKIEHENEDYSTLSGLIYNELGNVPQENTQFETQGLRITILKMDNQRIEKVKIEIIRSVSESIENKEF